jgi:ubiquinone/menaquinone biosynthesis C-methylase UbiE
MRGLVRNVARRSASPCVLVVINSIPRRLHSTNVAIARKSHNADSVRQQALERYGLNNLNLVWPERAPASESVDYTNKNPRNIRQMYGEADLSKLPIFQGGFINFGYWPASLLKEQKITEAQRVAASKEMYKVVGSLAGLLKSHNMLEIGCGLGYGASFISQQFKPKLVVGVDISPDQIARAKRCQIAGIEAGKLRFTIGEAESMPFIDGSFDAVISVEAAQHFDSMSLFAKETARILKPGGKLVMTSFFPKSKEGVDALNAIVPDYHVHGSQRTINEVENEFKKQMVNVKVNSIGKNVWNGFSRWLDQIGYCNQWSKIWPHLYEKNLIDYVIYQAEAPKPLVSNILRR